MYAISSVPEVSHPATDKKAGSGRPAETNTGSPNGAGHAVNRRALRRDIRQLSASLGATPETVASNLMGRNMRGVPRNHTRCPLARYMAIMLRSAGPPVDIFVSDRSVHARRPGGWHPMVVRLPPPVLEFMAAFDNGAYPELIDPFRGRQAASAGTTHGLRPGPRLAGGTLAAQDQNPVHQRPPDRVRCSACNMWREAADPQQLVL